MARPRELQSWKNKLASVELQQIKSFNKRQRNRDRDAAGKPTIVEGSVEPVSGYLSLQSGKSIVWSWRELLLIMPFAAYSWLLHFSCPCPSSVWVDLVLNPEVILDQDLKSPNICLGRKKRHSTQRLLKRIFGMLILMA